MHQHDGLCKINNLSADDKGNIEYQDWEILVSSYFYTEEP